MARKPKKETAARKPAKEVKKVKAPARQRRPAPTREGVLNLLKERRRKFTLSEEIGNTLNIPKAAVWKYIAALRKEGHIIESHRRKGYKLVKVARK